MKWIAAASVAVAIAAGVFAFMRDQAAGAATARVVQVEAEAQKARAEMNAARAERDALRKESADLKAEAQKERAAAETAGQFLEMEKAINAKLREDLAMVAARLAASGAQQRRVDTFPPGVLPPGLMPFRPPPPIAVRAAPGGATAAGAAAAAR